MIVDAWAQHPTLRHVRDPIFDSLRRWNREEAPTEELPVAATIRAMDAAGVAKALISAWVAPRNVMISNDEVAGFVAEYPDRLAGIGSVDTSARMVRRYPQQLLDWLCSNGARKVLFGSNYPMIQPAKALDGLDDLDLSPETRALLLGGNAERVYDL